MNIALKIRALMGPLELQSLWNAEFWSWNSLHKSLARSSFIMPLMTHLELSYVMNCWSVVLWLTLNLKFSILKWLVLIFSGKQHRIPQLYINRFQDTSVKWWFLSLLVVLSVPCKAKGKDIVWRQNRFKDLWPVTQWIGSSLERVQLVQLYTSISSNGCLSTRPEIDFPWSYLKVRIRF